MCERTCQGQSYSYRSDLGHRERKGLVRRATHQWKLPQEQLSSVVPLKRASRKAAVTLQVLGMGGQRISSRRFCCTSYMMFYVSPFSLVRAVEAPGTQPSQPSNSDGHATAAGNITGSHGRIPNQGQMAKQTASPNSPLDVYKRQQAV